MRETSAPGAHLSEEDLILHHYGEPEAAGSVAADHLAACQGCREEYGRLAATLEMVTRQPVPERDERYGAQVWRRLRPRLERSATNGGPLRSSRPAQRRWAMAAAAAMMMVAAFLAGRLTVPPGGSGASIPDPARERILLLAVGDHLERSQMMLVELLNADGGATVDLTADRRRAEELVADGRIYRQSAAGAGDAAVAGVLEDLERVLLDIAHGPATASRADLEAIQRRIREKGILLEVRLIGSQVRQREKSAGAGAAGGRT